MELECYCIKVRKLWKFGRGDPRRWRKCARRCSRMSMGIYRMGAEQSALERPASPAPSPSVRRAGREKTGPLEVALSNPGWTIRVYADIQPPPLVHQNV